MSRSSAWSIKGVDFDAREAAREAAARAGLSLGDWLNEVISEQARAIGVDEEDFDEDDRREAVSARLRNMRGDKPEKFQMRGKRGKARRQESNLFDNDDDAPYSRRAAFKREDRRSEPSHSSPYRAEQMRAEQMRAEQLLERALEDFDRRSERANRRAERAVADMAEMLETVQERSQYGEEALEAVSDKLALIERRLAQQNKREEERRDADTARERKAYKQSYAGLRELDEKLSEIGKKLEGRDDSGSQDRADRLAQMERRLAAMSDKLETSGAAQSAPARRAAVIDFSAARRPFHDSIAEITARQRQLDNLHPVHAVGFGLSSSGPSGSMEARAPFDLRQSQAVSPLEARLASLIERLDEKISSSPSPQTTSPTQAPAEPSLDAPTKSEARTSVETAQNEAFQRLEQNVTRLSAQFDKMREDVMARPTAPSEALATTAVSGLQRDLERMSTHFERLRDDIATRQALTADFSGLDDALAQIRQEMKVMARGLGDLAPRESVSALERAMQDLALQVQYAREHGVREVNIAPLEQLVRELRDSMAGLDSRPAVAALERELRVVAQKIDSLERRGGADPQTLQAILDQTRDVHDFLRHAATAMPSAGVHKAIAALTDKIERSTQGGLNGPELSRLIAEVRKLGADADSAGALRALEARMDALTRRIDQALAHSPAHELDKRLETLQRSIEKSLFEDRRDARTSVNQIEHAVADLAAKFDNAPERRRIDEFGDRLESLQRTVENTLRQGQDLAPNASRIENAVAELAAKIENAPDMRRLDEFGQRLDMLQRAVAQSLNAPRANAGQDFRQLEAMVSDLAAKMERAADLEADRAAVTSLERQIEKLAAKIEASQDQTGPLASLQKAVADIFAELEHTKHIAVEAAERAAQEASERVARSAENSAHSNAAAADVERAAAQAARQAIADAMAMLEANHTGDPVLARELANLKDSQGASDKRTHSTLLSVHQTLEKIVERLGTLEDDLVSAHAASRAAQKEAAVKPTVDETQLAAQNALLQAIQSQSASGEAPLTERAPRVKASKSSSKDPGRAKKALDSTHSGVGDEGMLLIEPGSAFRRDGKAARAAGQDFKEEASASPATFIAAARRAMQATQAAQANASRKVENASLEPNEEVVDGLLAKIKAQYERRKRPILLSFAAIVMLMGTLAVVDLMTGAPEKAAPAPSVDSKQKIEAPAPALAPAQAPVRKPVRDVSKDQRGNDSRTDEAATSLAEPSPEGGAPTPNASPQSAPQSASQSPPQAQNRPPAGSDSTISPSITGGQPPSAGSIGGLPTPPTMAPRATPNNSAPAQSDLPNNGSPRNAAPPKRAVGVDGLPVASINRSDPKMVAAVKTMAEQGDPSAQYELGVLYSEGREVPVDSVAAAQWFEKAALKGVAPAQYRLGLIYERGAGVPKNLDVARQWHTKAAERGNVRSMHNLAVMIADGDGKPNFADAAIWFRKAAERGLRDSQFNLAVLYGRGLGVPRDLVESYTWFSIAANQGDKEAARKRDEIGATLDAKMLARAKDNVSAFRPTPLDKAANEVSPPSGGWQAAAELSRPARPKATRL